MNAVEVSTNEKKSKKRFVDVVDIVQLTDVDDIEVELAIASFIDRRFVHASILRTEISPESVRQLVLKKGGICRNAKHDCNFILKKVDALLLQNVRDSLDEPLDCSLEVIDAALSGKLDMNNFDLVAYAKTVKKNETLVNYRRGIRNLPIIADCSDVGIEPYGVPESVVSVYAEPVDEYENVDNEDEIKYAVNELTNMEHEITSYYRINLRRCMTQALKGIPAAIEALKKLICDDPYIGELIRIVLSSGYSFTELFAEVA